MIIECENCLKKFTLDENRLRKNGSKVKCTKCGAIFLAFPLSTGSNEDRLPEFEINTKKVQKQKDDTPTIEKRVHNRIQVSVPVSCISADSKGNPLDLHIGRITDVSKNGLAVEIFARSSFEFSLVSFINVDDKEVKIKGKVVHSETNEKGKTKIGLSLIGTPDEISYFISQIVRYHHYSSKPVERVQAAV